MLSSREARELRDNEFRQYFSDEFLLNTDQAAIYLQLSASALNHWRSDGYGPVFVRLGGRGRGVIRYRMADLRKWIEEQAFQSTAEADMALSRVVPFNRVPANWTSWSAWTDWRTWDKGHPFILRNLKYVVDSAYADRDTFYSALSDPYVLIRWLKPADALEYPWIREDHRQQALAQYLAVQDDVNAARERIREAVYDKLWHVPEEKIGGHPLLTVAYHRARYGNLSNDAASEEGADE